MIKLLTLGGVKLANDSGEPVSLRSRKHLGLLLLLVGGGRRVYTRSRLCELFWTSSESRARHSLSQAMYDLNQQLGPIVTRGTGEDVILDTSTIDYDVRRFEQAIKSDDLEEAVAIYEGPFADNLIEAGTHDFERWLDTERLRLSRLGEISLRRYATECETTAQWGSMAIAALKLLSLVPQDESVHLTYMRALWLHGDPASALHHFQTISDASGEDGVVSVSEEMRDLVLRIETRPKLEISSTRVVDWEPPFLGREVEFQVLREAVSDMEKTDTATIVIRGEAGIGKSRLLREFSRSLQVGQVRIISSRCYQAEEEIPYTPIVDALIPVATEMLRERPGMSRRFSRLAYLLPGFGLKNEQEADREAVDPSVWKRQVYEDVTSFVAMIAAEEHVVWTVDDVQWIDRASSSLLHYVSRRLVTKPFLLVCTVRAQPDSREIGLFPDARTAEGTAATISIPLGPLSDDQVAILVRNAEPDGCTEQAAELAVRLAAGNPYYALEVLEAAVESSEFADGARDWDPLNDVRLRSVLDVRLRDLGPKRIRLLQSVSVLDRYARPRLVALVAREDLSEAASLAEELYIRGLILDDEDRLAFASDTMREYVYGQMTAIERMALHHRAGQVLEAEVGSSAGALATHFYHGDDWLRSYGYALDAARSAQAAAGHVEAAHFAGIAERVASCDEDRRTALEVKAASMFAAGDLASAALSYQRILECRPRSGLEAAKTQLKLAATEIERCNWVGANQVLTDSQAAISRVESLDQRILLVAERSTLVLKHAARTNTPPAAAEATEAINDALEVLETSDVSDETRLAVLTAKAVQVGLYGPNENALGFLAQGESSVPNASSPRQSRFYTYRGVLKAWMANWDGAEADFHRARELAEVSADRVGLATQWNNLACVALERGDWAEASERLIRAGDVQVTASKNDASLPITLNHANLLFYQGFTAKAATVYAAAAELCDRLKTRDREPEVLACLGLVALQRRSQADAARYWDRFCELRSRSCEPIGSQERFKVAWFSAAMTPGAIGSRALLAAADSERERDYASYLKLHWLDATLAGTSHTSRVQLRDALHAHALGWFCHVAKRWANSARVRP